MNEIVVIAAALVVAALTGLAVRRWFAAPAIVESSSMEPTLRAGQRLVMRRLHGARRVGRGVVVVIDSAEIGRVIVKRVIGLPGELIRVGQDGRVWVDGGELSEPYASRGFGPAGTFAVPAGSLFLLGDNRTRSSDSRVWRQPYLPVGAVLGTVIRYGL